MSKFWHWLYEREDEELKIFIGNYFSIALGAHILYKWNNYIKEEMKKVLELQLVSLN